MDALLSMQVVLPHRYPLLLPAVCLSRELCPCVRVGSAWGRGCSHHPSMALSCLCAVLRGSNHPTVPITQRGWVSGGGSSGRAAPQSDVTQPFQRGHTKPQPSLTLLFPPRPQGCVANFSSLMGYQYHQKRCGKQLPEADKPVFSCPHCGKKYKSKAGHDYHMRSEHASPVSPPATPAAPGAGPAPPSSDCRAAEPVGRTEPGKAGGDIGPMLFSPSHHTYVVRCSAGGGMGCSPLWKMWSCICAVGSVPFASACGSVLQPTPHPCSAGKKNIAQAARQHWGGRICPWGASFSVPLSPTDSASDANHSLTLKSRDVYTWGSAKGCNRCNAWLSVGRGEPGVLPCSPAWGHKADVQTQNPNPSIPVPGRRACLSPPITPFLTLSLLQPPEEPEVKPEPGPIEDFERTPSGRIRRTSAQVAVFHLQEIAEDELAKDWTKRRMKDDLVPETKRVRSFYFSFFF